MAQLNGISVGKTGLGLMRMTWAQKQTPDEQCFAVMKKSLEFGANFWNSGEFYGAPEPTLNLQLLNRYFTKYPEDADKVVLSVKGGINLAKFKPDGSPEGVKRSIDNILKLLGGTKKLDLFECARVDTETPVETTIEAIAEYIKAGKLGGICLSECSEDTIRRAAKVHKISGVEVEYSLFSTDIRDNGVLAACKDNDIPIIAYSPVGAGFLTGQIKKIDDFPEGDRRKTYERFQPGNFEKNFELVDKIKTMAEKHNATTAQLALAWVRGQSKAGPLVIPIPGTTNVDRLVENCKEIDLGDKELQELEDMLAAFTPTGGRYDAPSQASLYGSTKPL